MNMTRCFFRILCVIAALTVFCFAPAGAGAEEPTGDPELPPVFAAQFPGYTGIGRIPTWEDHIAGKKDEEEELAWLAETPEGERTVLCGTKRESTGWTVIESAPLPAGTEAVLYDGILMLDLGNIRCSICRYRDDLWGIYMVGWYDYYIGPDWVGSKDVLGRQEFGEHPWGDLTTIDWATLQRYPEKASKFMDASRYATPNRKDVSEEQESLQEMTALRETPDEFGDVIVYLVNGAPLTVKEKNDEWTHVIIGREDGAVRATEGWIRTDELAFADEINPDTFAFRTSDVNGKRARVAANFRQQGQEIITEMIIPHANAFEIGEGMMNGQYYKLLYFLYTGETALFLQDLSIPVVY